MALLKDDDRGIAYWPFEGEEDWPARDAWAWLLAFVALACAIAVVVWL